MTETPAYGCVYEGCQHPHHAKGRCKVHYVRERNRERYFSDPEYRERRIQRAVENRRTRVARRRAEETGQANG
jgi:hypothetical protein